MSKKRIGIIIGIVFALVATFFVFTGSPKEYYGSRGQISPGIAWTPERCLGLSFPNPHKTVEGPNKICFGLVSK